LHKNTRDGCLGVYEFASEIVIMLCSVLFGFFCARCVSFFR